MKVVIAAGGTGGHFYPGLAVARELMAAGDSVSFIIKRGDFVLPLLEREKIPYIAIPAGGFNRKVDVKNLFVVFNLLKGFWKSIEYLRKIHPNVLLVMGGYLSVPPALAARLCGIPVVLHEQNKLPGLANRLLSRLAEKIAVSFSESIPYFGEKAILTGNPVRREFAQLPSRVEALKKWSLNPSKKTVFVFGGSLGAHRLNQFIVDAFSEIESQSNRLQVIHITGPSDVMWVKEAYGKTKFEHYVDSYCHDMPSAYAASDLVICRAGASTISELMVVKKPALLVPYPFATADHQTANATTLEQLGVAKICQEKNLSNKEFIYVLNEFAQNPQTWTDMSKRYQNLSIDPVQAAGTIASLVREEA